ncbi:MAG TPA: ABC transporter substrate-binding protein [Solirubrobacterales bacterium]|nr:ABC transporter substrate-binding protein [Solirubrobacterales bacterium]
MFARPAEPTTLDPNTGQTENFTIQSQIQIFDQLLELRPGSDEVQPGLAKSWEQSKDGLSWTFHLRDAKFSNGRPVTAEDVAFSLERVLDPEIDANFAEVFGTFMKSVSAPDPHTAVIHLKHPTLGLPYWLVFNVPSIVSKVDFERMGADRYAVEPIGSGPFKVESWQKGRQLTLVRNPHYWRKGLPYLDKVELTTVPDGNTRILQVTTGEVDIADDLPYSQFDALESNPDVTLLAESVVGTVFQIALNINEDPIDEAKVRQALNYALPKEEINDAVFQGRGEIANSVMPRVGYWSEDVEPYPYDLDKAKELLEESSVPDGFTVPMEIVGSDEASKQTAQIIQQAWAKIGVDLEIVQTDAGTSIGHIFENDYTLALSLPSTWSSDIPSEDEFAVAVTSELGETVFGFKDEGIKSLVEEVTQTTDESVRVKRFPEVQRRLLRDNPPFAPIVFIPTSAAYGNDVHGFEYAETGWWSLDSVWIGE